MFWTLSMELHGAQESPLGSVDAAPRLVRKELLSGTKWMILHAWKSRDDGMYKGNMVRQFTMRIRLLTCAKYVHRPNAWQNR